MKEAFKQCRDFLVLYAVFLVVGMVTILATDKFELHLWFNQWVSGPSNYFFRFVTLLAEGLFIGLMILIGLIYKVRYGVAGLVGVVASGLLTQFLKRGVFTDHFRPSKLFEGIADLNFVEGVALHKAHSFPSGHSTSAFALFLFLSFIVGNRSLKMLCFLFALLTAYSRVYLSQHFFEDIYVGSFIGTTICFLSLSIFQNQTWGDRGLLANFEANRG